MRGDTFDAEAIKALNQLSSFIPVELPCWSGTVMRRSVCSPSWA